ncbi:transcription initiation factor TFIID subunit 3 isoform X1 [Acyrthosiphon pisum]|uniref:PHD-type domain-containing protein n=1 Tax=Acyrthosiphon pisum TaxID=7029 RepID=A0A8R2JSF8_ACYPI|nr:transcription initiation factor TFIID subunit 3 isoform X2 [Acyrthosiphon pisum]XP_029345130.1 transcription initiation factor TFIID subunit 3 isoform X1 [Acyrthosiphon pisum]|eukprot:XP_008178376.1 PREDICTED: transcription initiation factor TFIID subunit 3 [Acyrthosiphon pisum]
MTDEFIRKGLTTSVAQICSNIGWHSMSNSTLQMMTDILYEYFRDLAQSVKKFSEISDTIEPDIDDVKMAFRDKDVAVPDLIRYLKQVGSIEFPHQVPKFPIPTKSNLNIMKPGSREIVTRPVYVHEHLPTMYPEQSDERPMQNDRSQTPHSSSSLGIFNEPLSFQESQASKYDRSSKDNLVVHRRLREISSVVMTTSGYLSPSREGKLPESRLMPFPNFKVNSSHASSSYPTVPPEVKGEHIQQRNKKLSQKTLNNFKEKGKNIGDGNNSNNINNNKNEDSKVKKLANVKETSKLKALKTGAIRESNQGPRLKKPPKIKDKSKLSVLNTIFDKPIQASTSHSKYSKSLLCDSEKLTTEPDKQKLNIFKKISKVKEDKNNDSSVHQISKLNSSIISRPNSTIVSSDILVKPEVKVEIIEEKQFKPDFFKPTVETKKTDSVHKPSIKETKPELDSNVPKKRKKKQKIPSDDNVKSGDLKTKNNGNKKSKNKHDSDLFSSPLKFSFFGHLPTVPGLLPAVPSILPPSLALNPLVPKYTAPNNVIPILEKTNTAASMMYLPLPGEDDFDKSEFDELSSTLTSEKKKVPTEKIKPKKEHKKIKKEKIKSKKKKDKKDKTKQKERSERKKEKLLKKLKNKEKVNSEESKLEPTITEEKEPEPVLKEEDPLVPKIKLKLPGSNGSSSSPSVQRKIVIKPIVKNKSPSECIDESHNLSKEKSPVERVKSSTIKSKAHSKDKLSTTTLPSVPLVPKEEEIESVTEPIPKPSKSKKTAVLPPSTVMDSDIPATTSGNASVSSAVTNSVASSNKHKVKTTKKSKKITTQPHPAFYFDDAGNQVWICPTCGKQDDGSPMVGCDGCDAWYHWVCVGIQCPPDCAVWYCPTCLLKRAERGVTAPVEKAKRGRPLKKKSIS